MNCPVFFSERRVIKFFEWVFGMTKQQENEELGFLGKNRIEALTDGVFAIAMTLLVLDLKVPELGVALISNGWQQWFGEIWPHLVGFFVSFVILGLYWVGHHNAYNYIRYVDRYLLWVNLLFLAMVSLLPFSTSLLSQYGNYQIADIFYGLNLIAIGVLGYVSWSYATENHRLVEHSIDPKFVEQFKKRIAFAPIMCVIAILFSFFNTGISLLIYLGIVFYYVRAGKKDAFWSRPAKSHAH